MSSIVVVTTVDSIGEARTIAEALVTKGLAACVQISEVESVYTWEGAVQSEKEFRVLAKTIVEQFDAVERLILDMHSYELPAIYGFPLQYVYQPYAEWVKTNSKGRDENDQHNG